MNIINQGSTTNIIVNKSMTYKTIEGTVSNDASKDGLHFQLQKIHNNDDLPIEQEIQE